MERTDVIILGGGLVGLALGIPGEAIMGLVGPHFVGGTGALGFLLLAEVVAATAVISEAALIYVARLRNLWVSVGAISLQAVLTVTAIVFLVSWGEFLYGITFMLSPHNYPLSALIAQQAGAFGIDWPRMMAFAVVSAVPVFVVYVASYRLLKTGLTMGAVK